MLSWLRDLLSTSPAGDSLAKIAENVAAKFLRNKGYTIITRNYRSATGEIDIIARDGKTLVFVEVKTRMADDPMPEDQVNQSKQHQITKSAKQYLTRYGHPQPPARFDVVAIVWPNNQDPQIRHTLSAFEPTF